MLYDAELLFLQNILHKSRLNTQRLSLGAPADERIDGSLRAKLGVKEDYSRLFDRIFGMMKSNNVYRMTDQFLCSYLFLLLPGADECQIFAVGPYLMVELTRQQIMEQAESAGVQPQQFPVLENYYGRLPVVKDDNMVFAPIVAFGECIWGGSDNFAITDINSEIFADASPALPVSGGESSAEEILHTMRDLETRYAYENEFIEAVSQGQTQRASMMLSGFSRMAFEHRLADPVRNMKNYCIIMNTLLRKAAEQGGVHPLYLDEHSSVFARRIEELSSADGVRKLMDEMFRTYCQLVKRNSTKHFSPPVQRAVVQIDADLGGDLSLKNLALTQNINASYLSVLFKKETGHTVTDYVNRKRIALAVQLLSSTKLQVQTVAQHCGITDANYFSKLFKKQMGLTPKKFRAQMQTKQSVSKGA